MELLPTPPKAATPACRGRHREVLPVQIQGMPKGPLSYRHDRQYDILRGSGAGLPYDTIKVLTEGFTAVFLAS
jgi:hypothetical protein